MDYKEYLKSVYYDVESPGSFTSPEKLYQVIKSRGQFKISRNKIKQWLREQDVYTLHKDLKRKFIRRKIITSGVDVQWGADLASVSNTAKFNDGTNYLLVVVDFFSKYLFVEPLKTKRAQDVLRGFDKIFRHGRKPHIIETDKGGEFYNKLLKSKLQKLDVNYFTAQNENIKVSPVERVIRTFRNKMHKFFQRNRTYRFLEHLQDLVDSYNATPHRSLPQQMSPSQVTKQNEALVWDYMYNKQPNQPIKPEFAFKLGDLVRIAYNKYAFQRDYQQKWTSEIFKISERSIKQGIPVYKLIDFSNEAIVGTFYKQELQKVDKNQDALWIIEKVIRKRKGGKEYLVKYLGWPSKYNSWIKKSDIQAISDR